MKKSLLLCGAGVWCVIGASASAQAFKLVPATVTGKPVEIKVEVSGAAVKDAPPAVTPPSVAGAAPAAAAGAKKAPAVERMEKFLKLKFDRRASAYLKAWSAIEGGDKGEAGDEKKEPTQTQVIDGELEGFSRAVTLGLWSEVGGFLQEKFPKEEDAKKAYKHLIDGLNGTGAGAVRPKPRPGQPMPTGQMVEQQVLLPGDVVELADAAPVALDKVWMGSLGGLLGKALSGGDFLNEFLQTVRKGSGKLGGEDAVKRMAAARLLISAGKAASAGEFLPDGDEAAAGGDAESLNLLALYYLALKDADEPTANLEKAWDVNQKLLAVEGTDEAQKVEALTRAVELAPRVKEELGEAWLKESFSSQPERGMEVLATIGGLAAQSRSQVDPGMREKKLELQSTAVESLLELAPERAKEWSRTLNVLAVNWLSEAQFSYQRDQSDSMQPRMQYDQYGNMYYANNRMMQAQMQQNNRMPRPIPTAVLLEMRPSDAWVDLLDSSLAPQMALVSARLFLKVNEEEKAFPYIEKIGAIYPDEGEELANEFIRVWAKNHDPNQAKRRTGSYMYFYGYSQRSDSIPLTRSKQERNLEELAGWVKRLSALPIKALDEAVLADAFVRTHSQAEVYQLEDIERVFGETEKLKSATLAKLLTTMRSNLASLWRDPKVQAASKTKRKDKELQAEVARGYEVASVVLERALERYPDAWELQLVKAAMAFDQNNYRKEQADDSGFTARKRAAFGEFARAAEMYAGGLESGEIAEKDEKGEIYTTWFYASLGASDLGALKVGLLSDGAQQEAVKEALLALPGEAAERHMARFANSLSIRMTSVKAEMKNRYLGAGLKISGDHKQAAAAKKLYDYYQDLVTEIQLVTRIDGSDVVGSGRPFGMFVDLKHTKMIEREAGGFSKYLTNQNNNPYAYNYGRPPENYRDKFEESAREALGEQFEVISVTFHSEKIQSRGVPEPGWRVTPYAYLLIKSRGSEVDTIPSLRMDLDFLDTSGYVVLPIESPKLPIDARGEAEARPFEELTLTQTLDEREAADGKLLLEVKATARGLVPELEALLEVKSAGFSVEGVDDQEVSVIELDAESEENRAVSERNWVVELRAAEGEQEIPGTFTFAKAKDGVEVKEEVFQRYDDADMMMAEAEISLDAEYGEEAGAWVIPAVGVSVVLLGLVGWLLSRPKLKGDTAAVASYQVPEEVTPFTVVALLRRIGAESNGNLGDAGRAQLDEAIAGVEASYFAEKASGDGVELRKIAEDWVRRAA